VNSIVLDATPGVFGNYEQAEGAIGELREDISTEDAFEGLCWGLLIGVALSSVVALILFSSFGPDWLLVGLIPSMAFGAVMGSFAGLYQAVRAAEERWQVYRLGEREILVASQPGSCIGLCAIEARRTMERHGARGFVDEVSMAA
jgi:hypothetical protein